MLEAITVFVSLDPDGIGTSGVGSLGVRCDVSDKFEVVTSSCWSGGSVFSSRFRQGKFFEFLALALGAVLSLCLSRL